MPTYAVLLEYQGEAFEGWQVQSEGSRTVQGCLREAVETLTGERVIAQGSGRTDTGVHAEGQVASLVLESEWDSSRLARALNGVLPRDIGVHQVALAEDSFHPLRNAQAKQYRYRIWNQRARSPLRAARFAHIPGALDVSAMQEAAALLTGTRDFQSFQAAGSDVKTTVRDLQVLAVEARPGGEIEILARGSGFLRYMVRNLVGTLLEVGSGSRPAASMTALLAQRDRSEAGPTAPACGLTLERVFYEVDPFSGRDADASHRHSTGKSTCSG